VSNNGLPGNQVADNVADKPEIECDAIKNESATGSRSPTDVVDVAEPSTGVAISEIASGDVEMAESSYNNETGATTNDLVDQYHATDQEATTVQVTDKPPQMIDSFCSKSAEAQLEDEGLSASSKQSEMESSCQEGETEAQISTGSTCLDTGFDAAAAAAEGDSLCTETSKMAFQQPETPTQPDPAIGKIITSPEPEMVINSDDGPVSPGIQHAPAVSTTTEQISTLLTPEIENQQHEMKDEVDSKLDVRFSLSDQSVHGQETPNAHASEQLSDLGGISGTNEAPEDAAEQPVQPQMDESLVSSERQTYEIKRTSATLFENTIEPCSEKVMAPAADEEKAIPTERDHFRAAATDPASPDQSVRRDEASAVAVSDHHLRSSVLSQRSGTESETGNASVEPCTFTFPDPPQHPYRPLAVDDDCTDDVFVEHSSPRNDAATSDEILPASVMTSSTTTATADASNVGGEEQPRGDESVLADAVLAPIQPPYGEEVNQERPPTPGGRSHEAGIPPTLEEAAAAATAPELAKDGERPGQKSGDEIRADEPPADRTIDKLKTSSSEPRTSSGDFSIATESTDATDQQFDDTTEYHLDQQQISSSADRRQLSLLIPGHDSELHASDNQVVVCIQSFNDCSSADKVPQIFSFLRACS